MNQLLKNQARLTLAIIVKDEANLLEGLLHHHQELFDQALVVDTGSKDNSREVALKAGARVLDFQWNDDFSAARNHGLKQINTPWILQLDCDERLAKDSFPALRAIVEEPADHCLQLPINNYTATSHGGEWMAVEPHDHQWCQGALGYMRTHPVRLFPNLPDLRFRGVIHENLRQGIKNTGLQIHRGTQIIHHTGLLEQEGLARRDELYGRLLEKKVQLAPNDLWGLTEYAKHLVAKGKLLEAEKLMQKGLSQENSLGDNALANLLMVEIQARLGKMPQALERLLPTIHRHPNHLLCWVQASALHMADGQMEKAKLYLQQGQKLFPTSAVLKQLQAKV